MKKLLVLSMILGAFLTNGYASECTVGIGTLAEDNQITRTPIVTLKCTDEKLSIYKNSSTEQFMRLQMTLLSAKYTATTCDSFAMSDAMPLNIYYQCNFEKAK